MQTKEARWSPIGVDSGPLSVQSRSSDKSENVGHMARPTRPNQHLGLTPKFVTEAPK